jgi:hypothetical protein
VFSSTILVGKYVTNIVEMGILFACVHCVGRLLSRVAAVTTPMGIPQCPPTPTHHARLVNKPVQELEQQLCADKEQVSSAVAVADLGMFLKQS